MLKHGTAAFPESESDTCFLMEIKYPSVSGHGSARLIKKTCETSISSARFTRHFLSRTRYLLPAAPAGSIDGAGHVLPAAHRGLDLAVAVGAFRDLHFGAVIKLQGVINKRSITFCAGCIHSHTTFGTFIRCHCVLLWTRGKLPRGLVKSAVSNRFTTPVPDSFQITIWFKCSMSSHGPAGARFFLLNIELTVNRASLDSRIQYTVSPGLARSI